MLQFEEARRIILEKAGRLSVETVSLEEAHGRVLREAVCARTHLPPFSRSAMDGYAFASESLPAEGSWELDVLGESRTGRPASSLVRGMAQAISTGAELPEGADTVIPHEEVERTERTIRSSARVRRGQHVRLRGEDLMAGQEALSSGTRLGAGALALAASLDVTRLVVSRRPRVRILCTGDELRRPGSPEVSGSIPESISIGLRALAMRACAVVEVAPYAPDERAATERAVGDALEGVDLLLTVGGVSVGRHDWVRPALEARGVALEFWKVAIKPGKPVALGRAADDGPLVLGLPGNPASALVTFALFGLPLLRAMQGDASPLPHSQTLPLTAPVSHKPGRLELVRARLSREGGATRVCPLQNQASGALTSVAWGDALAMLPAEVARLDEGELIETLRWDDL